MTRFTHKLFAESEALFAQMRPLLGDVESVVQGMTLAQLVALFLAGHVVTAKREADRKKAVKETDAMREDLLAEHVKLVRELIPVMVTDFIEPRLKGHGEMEG